MRQIVGRLVRQSWRRAYGPRLVGGKTAERGGKEEASHYFSLVAHASLLTALCCLGARTDETMQANTDDGEDELQIYYTTASGPAPAPAPTTSAGAAGGGGSSSPGGHSCSSSAAATSTPLDSPRGVVEAAGKLRDLLAGGD